MTDTAHQTASMELADGSRPNGGRLSCRSGDRLDCPAADRLADLTRDNERLRAAAHEWARAEAGRNAVLRRQAAAEEAERGRIARALHNQVEQLLAGIALAVATAAPEPPPGDARLRAEVQRLAAEVSRQVHALAVRLRPTALDDFGLEAALAGLVRGWSARTGVAAEFVGVGLDDGRLPPAAETAVYRVVEDALANAAEHARATQVSVLVTRPDGHALAVIEDNGVGFDPTGSGRLALAVMRERVGLFGGVLEVESAPGAGTVVYARVPVPAGSPLAAGRTTGRRDDRGRPALPPYQSHPPDGPSRYVILEGPGLLAERPDAEAAGPPTPPGDGPSEPPGRPASGFGLRTQAVDPGK